MPESAVAELAPAPTAEEALDAASLASFNEIHGAPAVPTDQQQAAPVDTPSKAKAEPAKAGEVKSSGNTSDIPGEFSETRGKPVAAATDEPNPFAAELPESASVKTKQNWAAARKANEASLATIAAQAREIETLKKTPRVDEAMAAKFKAVETERGELQAKLERSDFQQSERFQKILKRETALIESAKGALKGTDFDPEVVDLAAHATGAVRRKILDDAGIEGSVRTDVMSFISRLDELGVEKKDTLENYKTIAEQDRVRKESEIDQARKLRVDKAIDAFERKRANIKRQIALPDGTTIEPLEPFLYSVNEAKPAWDDETGARHTKAQERFQAIWERSASDEDLSEWSFKSVGYDYIADRNKFLKEENARLDALVKSMTAKQPGAGGENGGRFVASNDATGGTPDDVSFKTFERLAAQRGQ